MSNFKAFDRAGIQLQVEHPDANTWIIKGAQNLHHLSYEVDDSWDSSEIKGDIFEPAGTNIQQDSFFVLNSFGFVGYLKKLEERPYQVRISKPKGFYGATSLQPSKLGMALGPDRNTLLVQSLDEATDLGKRLGFQVGDNFVSMNGQAFDLTSCQSCFEHYSTHSQLGDTVTFVVKRKISDTEEKELTLQANIREEIVSTILLNPDPKASAQQLFIRSIWMGEK